jgi:hypothetical protein
MKYYLRIEGVNLNNFVYDTQDLSTIRGSGLAILNAVNVLDDKTIEGIKLNKISTGASAGLFSFETADSNFDSKNFCQKIREELNNQGNVFRYATFAIDVLPFDQDATSFQTHREKTLAQNRWQQMQSPRFVFPLQNKEKKICQIDSITPAKSGKEKIKGEEKFVSQKVFELREYGKTQKQTFVKNQVETSTAGKIKKHFSYHLEQLTTNNSKENLHHKMAVIYLDGNDFGAKQRKLDIAKLKTFDTVKTNYQRNFLASLMQNVVSDKNGDWKNNNEFQLEILLWGGDEICLVVPAWKGWEVVELFYNETKELKWDEKPLTHSVGIVFCHHNAPIRRIKELAENLAGLAKDKSRKDNFFAYEILESFDHIGKDLEEHRKKRCPQIEPIDPKVMILDGNKISEITKGIKEVKKFFPRRKLTEIVFNLLASFDNSTDERKNIVDDLIKAVSLNLGKENLDKWCRFTKLFENPYSAYIHALELWDYVEEEINAES